MVLLYPKTKEWAKGDCSIVMSNPEISVIGGGTGNFAILSGLKEFTSNIAAIPAMADDGGSTGELRDEIGVLPPGDIRQCLVALSNFPDARAMFTYRPDEGPGKGHPTGNLILSREQQRRGGDLQGAVDFVGDMLRITGQVAPVSLEDHRLVMYDGDEVIEGEKLIDRRRINHPDATIELNPNVVINPRAAEAIHRSDLLVFAPGDIYGSTLAALAVEGMREVIKESDALKVVIANLVNKPGHTDGWHAVDYVQKIGQYIGNRQIDCVLYNNVPPNPRLQARYARENEYPVDVSPERFREIGARAIGAALVSNEIDAPSYIRHDGTLVGSQLMRLLNE